MVRSFVQQLRCYTDQNYQIPLVIKFHLFISYIAWWFDVVTNSSTSVDYLVSYWLFG